MSASSPSPLISIELLADGSKNPSALLIEVDEDASGVLSPVAAHPDFRDLCGRFPCFVQTDGMSPPLMETLLASGCQPLATATVQRSDQAPADLPPGVRWSAGDWYLAPPAKPSPNQAASRALALQLVQLVSADADTHEIEDVLRRDPSLSYQLLRLVNSLGMGLSRQVTSFSQAILILGRAQLRRWLNLMLFSARAGDERCAMLLARVAVRARLMELLAKSIGMDKSGQETAFMAGMFSLLGILFGMPLDTVLRPLKISDELLAAVLRHEGEIGRLLRLAETAERRDLPALAWLLDALPLAHEEFNLSCVQAYGWMLGVIQENKGSAHG